MKVLLPATKQRLSAAPVADPASTPPAAAMPQATTSAPTPSAAPVSRQRFFVNVGLMITVVVVVCLWFQRHVEHHVNASRLIGGTLSLWALFELIKGCIDWAAEDEMKALPQRVLGSRHSTGYLVLALIIGSLLHACTSSIWVEYEAAENAKAAYKVEARYDQPNRLPFIDPLTVTSARTIEGRTFFFRWRGTPLRFDVVDPRGFLPVRARLGWGERIHFTVPADFARKRYHLLRLLPTPDVMSRLEEVGGPAPSLYVLELKWGDQTFVVDDVRRQAIYVGAEAADMDEVIADEAADARTEEWNALLHQAGMSPELRTPLLGLWGAKPALRSTPEFGAGTKVQCRIYRRRDDQTIALSTATIGKDHAITSLLLSRPEP